MEINIGETEVDKGALTSSADSHTAMYFPQDDQERL